MSETPAKASKTAASKESSDPFEGKRRDDVVTLEKDGVEYESVIEAAEVWLDQGWKLKSED